jgi:hypothetical protein
MPQGTTTTLNGIVEPREAVQAVGKVLTGFLKSGPQSIAHLKETEEAVVVITSSIIVTSKQATENYAATCRAFLERVKEIKGIPTRIISGGSASGPDMVSSSGDRIREKFPGLLPSLMERLDWCIQNYGAQASLYREDQLARFRQMVSEILEKIPTGGSKDKALKQQITKIKSEMRILAKWDELFGVYKASSFPT